MRRRYTAILGAAACLVAAIAAWPQAGEDPLDSLKVCAATQRLMLENQFVRVIDDNIPVGAKEPLHRHRHGVVVYLTDYTVKQTSPDGAVTTSARKTSTASWSEAVVHTVENTGSTPSHAIRIELKF
jgi:beta-alanine degradation protein BauB